ncbi:unnamed protein product [Bursaphelenchus xylophilus]|uniref:(pine wood nematode) hypothetical protein n=1 Tax=Bursaphelenchus xylophilus TaxID=6326 RepID=A0A811KBQ5_BURXY|nr:unnamed protein product [Bursaphelenchus xylophilus]CAG9091966.1 unnamed protein product [Bursaphelenchus xylophilus]
MTINISDIEYDYQFEVMALKKEDVTIEQTLKEKVDVSIKYYRIKWKRDKVEIGLTLTINVYQKHAVKQIVDDCGINDEDFHEGGYEGGSENLISDGDY